MNCPYCHADGVIKNFLCSECWNKVPEKDQRKYLSVQMSHRQACGLDDVMKWNRKLKEAETSILATLKTLSENSAPTENTMTIKEWLKSQGFIRLAPNSIDTTRLYHPYIPLQYSTVVDRTHIGDDIAVGLKSEVEADMSNEKALVAAVSNDHTVMGSAEADEKLKIETSRTSISWLVILKLNPRFVAEEICPVQPIPKDLLR